MVNVTDNDTNLCKYLVNSINGLKSWFTVLQDPKMAFL
jgi:hypothetical protein